MKYRPILAVAGLAFAAALSSPAAAQSYTFNFATSTPLIGGAGAGSGTVTTNGITFNSRGYTAQTITGITGIFNGSSISGLATPFGADNLYYLTGPSFLDGSGLGFTTAAGTNVNLFYQDSTPSYRINTTGPFTSSFVTASSAPVRSAVPEPATWAMMLVGFGAVGAATRHRRGKLIVARA